MIVAILKKNTALATMIVLLLLIIKAFSFKHYCGMEAYIDAVTMPIAILMPIIFYYKNYIII